jgi:hypothetical protein
MNGSGLRRCVGEGRRGGTGAGRRLLVILGLLCLLATAALATAGAASGQTFSNHGRYFSEPFKAIDSRYWTDQVSGGVEMTIQQGLIFSVPAELTEASFQGLVAPTQDFYIKSGARFELGISYVCSTWPRANGTSIVLMATVFDKTNTKQLYQMSLGRQSNNYSRNEEFSVSVWGPKKKHLWKVVPADDTYGYLEIRHDEDGFALVAAKSRTSSHKSLVYRFTPTVKKFGKTTWSFMVQGQQAYWAFQPVTVRLARFHAYAPKGGFHRPPTAW